VTGTVVANLPVVLLGLIHITGIPVNSTIEANRRDVNIMLVLDHSAPMGPPVNAIVNLQADAVSFINLFANNRDNIGLVAFTGAPYVFPNPAALPNQNFQANLPGAINSLQAPTTSSYTNTSAALWTAYQQLVNLNQPGALNVIVLFTDGLPGALTADFGSYLTSGQAFCVPSSPLKGVIWAGPDDVSYGALANATASSITDTPDIRPATGCSTYNQSPALFLTQIPPTDIFGNSTIANYTLYNNSSGNYGTSLTGLGGRQVPANITGAATSAFDYAANQIRSGLGNSVRTDTALKPVIFTIGLGAVPPDAVLMARVANDPTSPSYNSNQPAGQYIYSPSPAQLQTAFTAIASQVLKLASN
jgi:hypothetical protein